MLGWSFRWGCFSRYSTLFLRTWSSLVCVPWCVFEQVYLACLAVRPLHPFAQLLSLITRKINHVSIRCSGELIPGQTDQVEHTSFLAVPSGLHRRLMNKGQCDISRFLVGNVSIHLLFLGFSAKILGSRGKTQAVFTASCFRVCIVQYNAKLLFGVPLLNDD